MNDDETLARLGYEAYAEETGGLNYQGLPMPTWEELSGKPQGAAWRRAAAAIRDEVRSEAGA